MHPDVNGGQMTPEYALVMKAYEILMDDNLRASYDATGIVPGGEDAKLLQTAHACIEHMFTQIVDGMSPEDMEQSDMLMLIITTVKEQMKGFTNTKAQLNSQMTDMSKRVEILNKRLSSGKTQNREVFIRLLKKREDGLRTALFSIEEAEKVANKVMEILEDCKFERKKTANRSNADGIRVMVVGNSATSTTTSGGWTRTWK